MQIASTDFQEGESIPHKYSAFDENINPALTFSEVPEEAESLALILEDLDTPNGPFTHWIIYNMSPATLVITPGELPLSGIEGTNDTGQKKYLGPKPPSGTHHYNFKLFALDIGIEYDPNNTMDRESFYSTIEGHIVDQAKLTGTFTAPS